MASTSSAVKLRYNKATYDRHEFRVAKDTELAHRLIAEINVAGLVKDLLCNHYGISLEQLHDYMQGG